jgi:hypothetical protein
MLAQAWSSNREQPTSSGLNSTLVYLNIMMFSAPDSDCPDNINGKQKNYT